MGKNNCYALFLMLASLPFLLGFGGHSSIELGHWQGRGNMTTSTMVCVSTISVNTSIRLGDGNFGNQFNLTNGKHKLPYELRIGHNNHQQVVSPSQPVNLRHRKNDICRNGSPITLSLSIQSDDLFRSPPGRYGGQLLVTVFSE